MNELSFMSEVFLRPRRGRAAGSVLQVVIVLVC